ncbi:MAG: hypothetical protein IJ473_01950 [Alphaproteobacteria bacterium]|nr:hypothetical protein [Alphaproteobacteria bacterium]
MTKKISILAIIFSGILSGNLYAETKNEKNTGTVGSETVNTQGHINKTNNLLYPNSYVDLSPFATVRAADNESDINPEYRWNATPKGDIFAYTLTDNNGKTFKGVNCPGGKTTTINGNSYCSAASQIEAGKSGNDGSCKAKDANGEDYQLTVPYGYKCENSYIIPDGYVKQEEEEGSGAYKGYFYRYWISGTDAEKFCEDSLKSSGCWSPAYPIIAYNGFTGFNIPNTEAGAELAKKAFGTREPGGKSFGVSDRKDIKNAYVTNNDYRMGVKVTAVTETDSAGKTVPKGGYHTDSTANLTVQKWKIVSGKGLDPDFNYDNITKKSDGNKTYTLKDIKNLNLLAETSDISQESDVLPCGMFQETSAVVSGVKQLRGTKCSSDHMRIIRDNLGPLYTKYNILLPTGESTFESSSTHDLKVRACAKCENMRNEANCDRLVLQLIDDGITSVDALVKKLREPFNNQQIKSGTVTIGSYSGTLECNYCLDKLDSLLVKYANRLTE